jgi:tyrosine-protein phosphatase SIW14
MFSRVPVRSLVASLFAIFLISAAAQAKGASNAAFPNVHIKNFGQMDERFFRGAEPKGIEDIQALKEVGINTVIDLQAKPEADERGMVESLGMRYVNIPMVDKAYPKPEWVAAFMKTVDDPATGKFFVHCAGGRHRTGSMGAVYRFEKYGWGYDQVYAEMKKFDFYTSWGHGDFKTFVEDYARQMQARGPHTATTAAAASSAETIFSGSHR